MPTSTSVFCDKAANCENCMSISIIYRENIYTVSSVKMEYKSICKLNSQAGSFWITIKHLILLKRTQDYLDNNEKEQHVSVHVLTLFHHDAILLLHVDFGGFWLFSMKTDTWLWSEIECWNRMKHILEFPHILFY